MNREEIDVNSKFVTLGAADLVPRKSMRRSFSRPLPQSKRPRTLDPKRIVKSPRVRSGFSGSGRLKRFSASPASTMKKRTLQSPSRVNLELPPTETTPEPSKTSTGSPTNRELDSDKPCVMDQEASTSQEQETIEQPLDSCPKECSVLCVDIDDPLNVSNSSGALETETEAEKDNEDEPGDTDSDSMNGETSSWHPSDDDATSASDSPNPPSRRSTHQDGILSSAVHRKKRNRKRLFCQCDSSESYSPSQETRNSKKVRVLPTETETSIANGSSSEQDKNSAPESDDYCWLCHKVGQMVICSCCPRVYHPACLCTNNFPETWLCPECQDLLMAECTLYQLPAWKNISRNQLQDMLLFVIDRLAMQQWAEHFREPVDTKVVEGYADLIAYPMDLTTLYKRTLSGAYASTQAFLSDFRWILHNCIVFNGSSSPLTSFARALNQACVRELALMRACPECYIYRMPAIHVLPSTTKKLPLLTKKEWLRSTCSSTDTVDLSDSSKTSEHKVSDSNTLDPWWFSKLCSALHPLVWVRLQYYPCWPAKVMAVDSRNMLVNFFGDYDVTTAPMGSARLHCDSRAGRSPFPHGSTASGAGSDPGTSPRKLTRSVSPSANSSAFDNKGSRANRFSSAQLTVDASYKQAMAELDYHLTLIKKRYPNFKVPSNPVDFTRRYYAEFRKTYGGSVGRSKKKKSKPDVPPSALNSSETVPSVDVAAQPVLEKSQSVPGTGQNDIQRNIEPVLLRVASGLHTPVVGNKADPVVPSNNEQSVVPLNVSIHDQRSSHTLPAQSSEVVALKVDVNNDVTSMEPHEQTGRHDDSDRPPTVLQPIPIIGNTDYSEGLDEVHALLDRMRTQFQESLRSLEEKWHITRASDERKHSVCREPPVLSAATVEAEVQTEPEPLVKRSRQAHYRTSTVGTRDVVDASTTMHHTSPSLLSPIQTVMMEGEIARLERENQRLNLLLAFTRAEMAFEMRHRIAELRRVWNFEVTAVLEAASSVWEQDLIRIVDGVKRKQWCAYCGRVAFYYCCWNTCYCNSTCQAKHWASHINSCVQARSQQALMETSNATASVGIPGMSSVVMEKAERGRHQPQAAVVTWSAVPVQSVAPAGLPARAVNTTTRGKLNA